MFSAKLRHTKVHLFFPDTIQIKTKGLFDFVTALLGIIIIAPVFPIIAFLIKTGSRGPIFYTQKRCGLGGKEFRMYKFRSMVNDADVLKTTLVNEAEGSVFKVKNDPRVTRIGKFLRRTSMDEIPQLFNVLRGEMSLIGPRPLSSEEMNGCKEWRELRLKLKPGITGLWQIKGRESQCFEDWIRYDKEYVLKHSLLLDIKILFLTIGAIITGKGAY